jgi:hypothetical protein
MTVQKPRNSPRIHTVCHISFKASNQGFVATIGLAKKPSKMPKFWQKHIKTGQKYTKYAYCSYSSPRYLARSSTLDLLLFGRNLGQFAAKKSEIAISVTLILNAMPEKPTNPTAD